MNILIKNSYSIIRVFRDSNKRRTIYPSVSQLKPNGEQYIRVFRDSNKQAKRNFNRGLKFKF